MCNTEDKIIKILEMESGIDISQIDRDQDLREQVNLDSMQFISISARIEEELDIELPISVMNVRTLNEFVGIVQKEVEKGKTSV